MNTALLLVLVTLTASAITRAQDPGEAIFDTKADPAFGDATVPLQELVRSYHVRGASPQHFCIVGYGGHDGRRGWVHWQERRRIILWEGSTNALGMKTSMSLSRRHVDLDKHVVASAAEIKGSNYLVTKDWVARIAKDCRELGAKYVVTPRRKN